MKATNKTPPKQESNIQNEIRAELPENARGFRNNVGLGWIGETAATKDGSMLVRNPRPLRAGLCKGSSDIIGWVTVEITPEMVGKKIAVFMALEVKTAKGTTRKEQLNFIEVVKRSGGVAGIVRSSEQANDLVTKWNHGV
jgi:hypothetical protein